MNNIGRKMEHIVFKDIDWKDIPDSGKQKFEIMKNTESDGIRLWNIPKGESFPNHSHKGYEYICVIKGIIDMSNNILKAGDFLLTHAGEEHQATALENTVILVINEKNV
jgi:anti-sigma factor ChrR (cupin superfamily)